MKIEIEKISNGYLIKSVDGLTHYFEQLGEALMWVVNIFKPEFRIKIEDHVQNPPKVWG